MSVAALILAAGASRRFGSDKRLHEVGGKPLLAHTLARYREVFEKVYATLRPGESEVERLITAAGALPIKASDAHLGQGRSLAHGVAALADSDGLIIGLGDMPFVQPGTLLAIANALEKGHAQVVRPRCNGQSGNPIGFAPSMYDALTRITGDQGARDLLRSRPDLVVYLDLDDAGVLKDVDRAEDLEEGGQAGASGVSLCTGPR